MKVIAINGSPRAEGNTFHALNIIKKELLNEGIELEIVDFGTKAIHGCTACTMCSQTKNERCIIDNDMVNETIQKMAAADGIILASPVYFAGIAGTMKCFLDRAFYVSSANGGLYRGKVAAAVTAVRRSGGSHTIDGLNHYITYGEMVVATSSYWNIVHGRAPGEMLLDLEGVQTMELLGRNIAWLLKMKDKAAIPQHSKEIRVATSFIR